MTGQLKIALGEFQMVSTAKIGRILRCTLSLTFHPEGDEANPRGLAVIGCIVMRDRKTGKLRFNGPVLKGAVNGLKLARLTPALLALLVDHVTRSRYEPLIGEGAVGAVSVSAQDVDPGLPEVLEVNV